MDHLGRKMMLEFEKPLSGDLDVFPRALHPLQLIRTFNDSQAPYGCRLVALIRRHLATIARRFSAGDFGAPEQIHGNDMPGLAVLRTAHPGELKIDYHDVRDGGEIVYRSERPRLVDALHDWFDAQLSDHGHDAMAGHDSGAMHHHPADASTR